MPVAAPLIGGAASMAGAAMSKPKSQKDPLAPYLTNAAQAAQGLYQQGMPQQFQGSTVAPMSGQTQQALGGIWDRATQGSPLVDQAQGYVQHGLGQPITSTFGDSANPYASPVQTGSQINPYAQGGNSYGGATNPFLEQTFNKAFGTAMQGVESQFARGGRNIGASMPVAGDIASSLASQIYAPAYENERNRQLSMDSQLTGIGANSFEANQNRALQAGLQGQQIGAQGYENAQTRQLSDLTSQRGLQQNLLNFASPLAAQDYLDLAQQQGVGQQYDAYNQAQLNDQVGKWNYDQQAPQNALNAYIAQLQGLKGATTHVPPAQQPNYLAAGLGGAMLGSQLFPGGYGTANGGSALTGQLAQLGQTPVSNPFGGYAWNVPKMVPGLV